MATEVLEHAPKKKTGAADMGFMTHVKQGSRLRGYASFEIRMFGASLKIGFCISSMCIFYLSTAIIHHFYSMLIRNTLECCVAQ